MWGQPGADAAGQATAPLAAARWPSTDPMVVSMSVTSDRDCFLGLGLGGDGWMDGIACQAPRLLCIYSCC
jgi:hypothetical protein